MLDFQESCQKLNLLNLNFLAHNPTSKGSITVVSTERASLKATGGSDSVLIFDCIDPSTELRAHLKYFTKSTDFTVHTGDLILANCYVLIFFYDSQPFEDLKTMNLLSTHQKLLSSRELIL
jgi:hypothetical protein